MMRSLTVILALVLMGCTAESTLKTLQEEFPDRKAHLSELKDLMLSLGESANHFIFLSSRVTGGKNDLLDLFEKKERIPVSTAQDTIFKSQREQLLKVQTVVHAAGIDYVSVDKERKAVWITLEGGGALSSDKGYLFIGKGEIASFHLPRVLPIPNESNWYAFD